MTLTRTRVYKYIILVNTVGAIVGAELSYLYFIYKKQFLSTAMWRCRLTKPNTYQSAAFIQDIFNLAETQRVTHEIHNY